MEPETKLFFVHFKVKVDENHVVSPAEIPLHLILFSSSPIQFVSTLLATLHCHDIVQHGKRSASECSVQLVSVMKITCQTALDKRVSNRLCKRPHGHHVIAS